MDLEQAQGKEAERRKTANLLADMYFFLRLTVVCTLLYIVGKAH